MRAFAVVVLLFAASSSSGCGGIFRFITGEPEVSSTTEAPHARKGTDGPQAVKRHGLQVTWQVPSEPVDGFIVRYGENPDSMKMEKRVSIDSLKQEDDPEFGPVYRFTIPDVDSRSSLYVSVAAFKGDRLSDFSQFMKDSSL